MLRYIGAILLHKPRPLAVIRNSRLNSVALLVPLRSVQFSSVALDARGCLAWTSLGIILFLRSLYSKFSCTWVGIENAYR